MEKRFNSYVDSDFLKAFLIKKSEFDIEDSGSELEIWRSLFKFFDIKTKLTIKLNKTTIKYLANNTKSALIYKLLKKNLEGSHDIQVLKNIDEKDQICFSDFENYNFVFISDQQSSQKISDHLGIEHIASKDFLNDWKRYYKSNTTVVPKQQVPNISIGWKELSIPKHFCNSLILCDNYLLHDKLKMENNLFSILDLLLPTIDLMISFDLTIFSSAFYNCFNEKAKKYKVPNNNEIMEIRQEILKYIKIDLNIQNINFSLVYNKFNKYHDRHLFTNGFVFKSGNSFNYFDETGHPILPSETTLDIQPYPADNGESTIAETYIPFLKSLKEIAEKSTIYIGTKENRLLGYLDNPNK